MQKSRVATTIFLAGSIGLCNVAHADQVLLMNGDHISGTIIELNTETLKINTDYAGLMTVKVGAIKSFHTQKNAQWQINLKERDATIHASNKPGHVLVNEKNVAINELILKPAQKRWKKSGLLETSLDVDNDTNRKEQLHINTEFNLESRHWRHALKAESKRDKERNHVTEDTLELNYSLDYLFDTHWLLRADTTYREEGAVTNNQYWYLGLGPGYRLWGEGKDKLDLILAYNRFWFSTDKADLELSAWALALGYEQFWFDEKLETFSDSRIAFPTVPVIDYIINTSSGLRYYLGHNIHISLKYDYKETRYILGSIKDSSYVLGAGVNF
ncbi:DUF481 domain-containing protein [Cellvibrio mixtus]|uniref:DUF481 domain-containing protein n=1 Tax=Cellvibrio mixtus TaxID=39650 RepID=UPI000586AAAD|nr:DUF481 domain-containing protein [Cellvibrio mixtus]